LFEGSSLKQIISMHRIYVGYQFNTIVVNQALFSEVHNDNHTKSEHHCHTQLV